MSLPVPSHTVRAAGTVDALTVVPVSLAPGSRQSGELTPDTPTGPSAVVAAATPSSPGVSGQGRSEGVKEELTAQSLSLV